MLWKSMVNEELLSGFSMAETYWGRVYPYVNISKRVKGREGPWYVSPRVDMAAMKRKVWVSILTILPANQHNLYGLNLKQTPPFFRLT